MRKKLTQFSMSDILKRFFTYHSYLCSVSLMTKNKTT